MKIYALLDYETLIKKEWTIERFISTCKDLHVEMIQYRDKQGDKKRKVENLQKIKKVFTPEIKKALSSMKLKA